MKSEKIAMARALLNTRAIDDELSTYNFHQLRKSAAVGAYKEERLKVAALIRQRELEKQAFLSEFCKQADFWSRLRAAGGVARGVSKYVGKKVMGAPAAARGAAQGAATSAKRQYGLAAGAGEGVKGTAKALARPQSTAGAAARRAQKMRALPNSQIRGTALRNFGGTLGDSVRAGAQGAARGARQGMRNPGAFPASSAARKAGIVGGGVALTQIPGHTGPATGAKGGQPKPKTYQPGSSVPGIGYTK